MSSSDQWWWYLFSGYLHPWPSQKVHFRPPMFEGTVCQTLSDAQTFARCMSLARHLFGQPALECDADRKFNIRRGDGLMRALEAQACDEFGELYAR
ncbi:hypothetical protein OCA5_c11600 [Afipia carboxidovorans OM5]|uniref:Uncharacterized protein n=1 Tax=Afipia carboxidovorans (strain ATCC 49405 / DSM 1227 / KCTC 32145 / OM5) TaxID=504832 RepID=F8BUC6_AFIC5|nr:hypothetical protein OCA4_c11600 [Afipia carboxidovorans OM4]AEI05878.1 hypothetical protein OCA5_c11600 [Afipia carboxidovorans OM5]